MRLSGLASLALGWSPEEFWRATPQELASIFAAPGLDGGYPVLTAPLTGGELQLLKEQDPDG